MCPSRLVPVTSFVLLAAATAAADNWPAWRGPTGQGMSAEMNLPTKWSKTENVKWKVPLPAEGNSTPAVWGDKVFVTQATEKGKKRSLICFARKDGSKLWEQTVEYTKPEPTHNTNPYCSASPATDGERVVVSHGSAGVFCYDLAGKELWRRDLGPQVHIWGNASSPVLHKNLAILTVGPGKEQYLLAVNKADGMDVWKAEEPGGNAGEDNKNWVGSWSTPVVADVKGRTELVMSWPGVVKAYNPDTGSLLWSSGGLERDGGRGSKLVYTSPIVTPEAVVAMAGYGGPSIAVKTGGTGDVTATHRLWRHPSAPQRIGTGVVVGNHLYVVDEPGTMRCVELTSGKLLWTERVGQTWSSITHAGGKLYVPTMAGATVVVAAKPTFEELARNPLGERMLASLAVSDGELFVRTYKHLWCIAAK